MKDNKLSIILCAFFLIGTFIISNCIGNKELILKDKEYGTLFDSKDLDDEFKNKYLEYLRNQIRSIER